MHLPSTAASADIPRGEENDLVDSLFKLGMRGYEVTAMVFCLLVAAAFIMCYVTWNCRYKIILRPNAIKEPTVVQQLVALTLQEEQDMDRDRASWSEVEEVPPFQLDLTVPLIEVPVSEIFANGHKDEDMKCESASPQKIIFEPDVQKEIGGIETVESKHDRNRLPPKRQTSRASITSGKQRHRKRKRAMVKSAVKLTSGQAIPKIVDRSKIRLGQHNYHPLGENGEKRTLSSTLGLSLTEAGYLFGKNSLQVHSFSHEKSGSTQNGFLFGKQIEQHLLDEKQKCSENGTLLAEKNEQYLLAEKQQNDNNGYLFEKENGQDLLLLLDRGDKSGGTENGYLFGKQNGQYLLDDKQGLSEIRYLFGN